MRLAIVNLTGGGFSGGYRKYLKNMLPRLAEHNDVKALLCISPEGNDIASWFNKPSAIQFCSCRHLQINHLVHIPDKKMAECLIDFSPDIIFMPVDRYIKFKNVPVVNMVRNMEPLVPNMKGDSWGEIFKKFIQRKLTCNSVRLATHTIAVSGFVKDYLTTKLHISENKISLVYHGLTPPLNCIRPATIPDGWDDNFLFTSGSIRPARGIDDALEAMFYLKQQHDLKLVIAGETVPNMKKYRAGLEKFVVLKGLANNVCWAGNLNEEEMHWCYEKCRLFIMTSRIEACPNIAMEAMSTGSIAIAANNPPLPEFFSNCAVYYEPKSGRSLAEAIIQRMSIDGKQRLAMSKQAKMKSSMFSWDLTADKTVSVLMRVLELSKLRFPCQAPCK